MATADDVAKIAATYKDDLYGYRRDVLGRSHADWQKTVGESIQVNKRTAVAAAHGVGKTGFAADLVHWFIATRPSPQIIATANTENQLKQKLWRELAKVNNHAKNGDWFTWKGMSFSMFDEPTQTAYAVPWSEENPEAFAGTHEEHVLGIFDEASAIPRPIFNTFAGAMSTAGARWVLFGNSTQNTGYFFDACHGKLKARKKGDLARGMWNSFIVKAMDSPFVEPSYWEQMLIEHGEESNEYRIRVLGLPPKNDVEQFIKRELIVAAQERELEMFARWPLILGIDVGRGDRSVIMDRRGRIAGRKLVILQGMRTTDFARRIAEEIKWYREEKGLHANCIIEELGMGVGVVETLQDWGHGDHVFGVNTGEQSSEPNLYTNLRCEMWGSLLDWMEERVEIPNSPELAEDLENIKRKPSGTGKLRLETKEEMRKRGLKSPDVGDGLALTFAVPFDLLPEKRDRWHGDAWRDEQSAGAGSWLSN